MPMRIPVLVLACCALLPTGALGDVGASVRSELTYVESSTHFRNGAVVNGAIGGGLQRWKLSASDLEQYIFTIDGQSLDGRVTREVYIRMTQIDPFSLKANAPEGEQDLHSILTPREFADFGHAASAATITEPPVHLIAYFYRGTFAAYEVIEPTRRQDGSPDRFEWRSFPLSQLQHAIALARRCDNGDDCAAWY
jgi:hypothetical protein